MMIMATLNKFGIGPETWISAAKKSLHIVFVIIGAAFYVGVLFNGIQRDLASLHDAQQRMEANQQVIMERQDWVINSLELSGVVKTYPPPLSLPYMKMQSSPKPKGHSFLERYPLAALHQPAQDAATHSTPRN